MKYLGLVVAIVVAIMVVFFVLQSSQPTEVEPAVQQVEVSQQAAPSIEEAQIYVAARDIPIGTKIDPSMITTQSWPAHLVVDGFIKTSERGENTIGMVTRASFRRDEPLSRTKLANPSDPNFLAGDLPKGMRVITMEADEISAVAGFVFPGDRVDVLITHLVLREGVSERDVRQARSGREIMEEVTETLLSNIRVRAVDQRATAGEGREGIIIPKSVSLEVSPENAQRLKLAEEIGKLSLALRSVEDKDVMETVAITRQNDLTKAEMNLQQEDGKHHEHFSEDGVIRIIRGTEVEELEAR